MSNVPITQINYKNYIIFEKPVVKLQFTTHPKPGANITRKQSSCITYVGPDRVLINDLNLLPVQSFHFHLCSVQWCW